MNVKSIERKYCIIDVVFGSLGEKIKEEKVLIGGKKKGEKGKIFYVLQKRESIFPLSCL